MALMDPPENWSFTHFLDEFCEKLNNEDLVRIRILFKGIVTENVRTWAEMIEILQSKGYISQYNIVYLQKIGHHLDRSDLHLLTIDYARNCENGVLHFENRPINLEAGQEEIRIHIEGHSCQTYRDLENMRRAVSEILRIDLQYIIITGVQEANSVLISLVLPTMYIHVFKNLLEDRQMYVAPLGRLGIDRIYIDGTTYEIDGTVADQGEQTEDGKKAISQLQHLLAQKEEQIKNMEKALLSQRKASNLGEECVEPEDTKKKRKYLPESDYDDSSKKFRHDFNAGSNLSQHELPEAERFLTMKPKKNDKLNEKMVQFSRLSTTFRKMIREVPEEIRMKGTQPKMTLEEINTMSLYAKLNRIYPRQEPAKKWQTAN